MSGADLRELQKQIENLPMNTTSPQIVGQFLSLRRDVMFLEFDTAVRHSMTDTFLATANKPAYDVSEPTLTAVYMFNCQLKLLACFTQSCFYTFSHLFVPNCLWYPKSKGESMAIPYFLYCNFMDS